MNHLNDLQIQSHRRQQCPISCCSVVARAAPCAMLLVPSVSADPSPQSPPPTVAHRDMPNTLPPNPHLLQAPEAEPQRTAQSHPHQQAVCLPHYPVCRATFAASLLHQKKPIGSCCVHTNRLLRAEHRAPACTHCRCGESKFAMIADNRS